ncbi:MAG TPA: S41 family peptidase [Pyrinomonadaceae bacterium]
MKKRTILRVLVFLVALSFYSFSFSPVLLPSSANAVVSTATREGRLAVFDDAWSRINERYYDRRFNGLDWDAQRTTFRPLAADAGSSQELYAILRRMIGSLDDPHTRVFAPEEKFDWWRPRFVSTGLAIAEVDGQATVVQVERGSAPQRAGVRVGDVIEAVSGEPASSLIKERLAISPGSVSASSRFRAFAKLLDGPPGSSVEVSWRTKDGKRESARFDRHWGQRELGVKVRRVQGEYAVIEIDAFTKPIAAAFTRSLKKRVDGATGIIIDLRGNGGGDAEAMADIASTFLGPGSNLGQFTDRFGISFTISTHSRSLFSPDLIAQTKLPLIVLTSERTSSAAEIFIQALKVSKRATILGTETCGCVLAVRTRHELPDGGLLDISELNYETAEGHRLEGHGIKPDEIVTVERSDLYSGRDRAVELAVTKLAKLRVAHHQQAY